jgi:L-alanine-DL-glutamate epimerase-like enolase superfamily enzyme
MPGTDIRVKDITWRTEEFRYRTPIKFGGVALDRVTLLHVTLTVESRTGARATGFGSMPLGNVWAWPSKTLTYDQTLGEMIELAAHCQHAFRGAPHNHHPVEIGHVVEKHLRSMAVGWHVVRKLPEPIPILAVLVVASAFDAALHDAYGRMLGLNCYRTYGPEFLGTDLSHYLGKEFEGETLDRYVLPAPKPTMPLYHLVGALDPLTPADMVQPVGDGLPETLGEWIIHDGLTHLKVKLNGDDLAWDVDRVVAVNRVAEETAANRDWHYSLDFNERCRDVGYLLAFLDQLQAKSARAYDRVQYIEQPTARDLRANPNNRMHDAAKRKPVVIDESLVDLESLHLARDMGYTGVAFKACKGQTQTLLLAAAAQKMDLFRCVQDLTCPGASLIHSAGIAAHIPGVAAIEANARQYCPAANAAWDEKFPGLFTIRNGVMRTGQLNGVGLSLGEPGQS